MNSFWNHVASNFVKIFLVLLGIAIVLYVLIEFRFWSTDWTDYFLRRGRWEEIIFVSLVVMGITMVVLKLFHWYLKLETR